MRSKADISIYFGLAFLALLSLLHFLEPEFDPRWRMISEYELGQYGYLMSLAFACWGGSYIFLSLALWSKLRSTGGKVGKWWLMFIGIASIGAGAFLPNQITEPIVTLSHKLHAFCGVMVIFTSPVAALIVYRAMMKEERFKAFKISLGLFTALVWVGLLFFFASLIIYKPVGLAYSVKTLIGFPNRAMVVVYTLWIIAASRAVGKVKE